MSLPTTRQRIRALPERLRQWLTAAVRRVSPTAPDRREPAPSADPYSPDPVFYPEPPASKPPEPEEPAMHDDPAVGDTGLEGIVLLSQRLDLLTERVELLQERLNALVAAPAARGDAPQAGSATAKHASVPPVPADHAPTVDTRRATASERLGPLGTLRPPPVPSGIDALRRQSNYPSAVPDFAAPQSVVAGPLVSGTLPDLCLATLLGLFELERRTGVLNVYHGDRSLQLELRDGVVLHCRLDGATTPAVQAVREAFRWEAGHFAFRPTELAADTDIPQSVSALLLEAMRQNDEAARAS